MTKQNKLQPARRAIFYSALFIIMGGVAFLALLLPYSVLFQDAPLRDGDVADQDYRAPQALTYESEILTQIQRERVAVEVRPVYSAADPGVARRQLERLRAALSFITAVRADLSATPEQKLTDLAALEDIHLDHETAQSILATSNSRWEAISREAIVVLEQVMRTTIREDRLEEARTNVLTLISLSLSEDQAEIVAELVSAFIAPNSIYNAALTEAAREQAVAAVQPVSRSFAAGETIVPRGAIISATDMEALLQFGLTQPEIRWQDLTSAAALILLILIFMGVYLRRNAKLAGDLRAITMMAALYLIFLVIARLFVPGHTVFPYLLPISAYALVVSSLIGAKPALVTVLPLAILSTYGIPYALELTIFYVISSLFGVLILGRGRRITSFFWTGLAVALSGAAVILVYRLPQPDTDMTGLLTLTGAAFINGAATAGLTLLLQFFLAQLLGMTTALQLMELSRPDHPLLQLLLRTAPGTYQHSLQVANLAEQAAERIGADALLTRVGALYHDAGKTMDPIFFIENQVPGNPNPHDELDPTTSASIIVQHVPKGLELARKYRLPRRIHDFISEHHGDMITRYQYTKALEAAGRDESRLNLEDFQYPGPAPQSKETALLMLADGCEARVRAEHPKNEEELRALIKDVIDLHLKIGSLRYTDLTLFDLETVIDSFTTTLRGIYHPRIKYPKLDALPEGLKESYPEDQLTAEPALEVLPAQYVDPPKSSL
ncbi:MAG: HDIG domain-containing protein [Anaerolineales bacterium]|jgi:cyclic-di-AMP phosphodiesterase PgpH